MMKNYQLAMMEEIRNKKRYEIINKKRFLQQNPFSSNILSIEQILAKLNSDPQECLKILIKQKIQDDYIGSISQQIIRLFQVNECKQQCIYYLACLSQCDNCQKLIEQNIFDIIIQCMNNKQFQEECLILIGNLIIDNKNAQQFVSQNFNFIQIYDQHQDLLIWIYSNLSQFINQGEQIIQLLIKSLNQKNENVFDLIKAIYHIAQNNNQLLKYLLNSIQIYQELLNNQNNNIQLYAINTITLLSLDYSKLLINLIPSLINKLKQNKFTQRLTISINNIIIDINNLDQFHNDIKIIFDHIDYDCEDYIILLLNILEFDQFYQYIIKDIETIIQKFKDSQIDSIKYTLLTLIFCITKYLYKNKNVYQQQIFYIKNFMYYVDQINDDQIQQTSQKIKNIIDNY